MSSFYVYVKNLLILKSVLGKFSKSQCRHDFAIFDIILLHRKSIDMFFLSNLSKKDFKESVKREMTSVVAILK